MGGRKGLKIGIFTHALSHNYGGLLQAFALQKVLKSMGHDPYTDRYALPKSMNICLRVAHFINDCLRRYLMGSKIHDPFRYLFRYWGRGKDSYYQTITIHTNRFIEKNIQTVDFFAGRRVPADAMIDQFDALIVGSDQVWRPAYLDVPTYFLNFTKNRAIKRIAYAVSFGLDHWGEFTPGLTERCQRAAQRFDAISVREDSAIELCRRYLSVDAIQVLDPTMLLDKQDYTALIEQDEPLHNHNLLCYILDNSEQKNRLINSISEWLGLAAYHVMPNEELKAHTQDITNCIYPSPSTWLAGFRDARFVVTDSFHGTVFAIIFNKPFVAISNSSRGSSRITSLLKLLGLEDRMIFSVDELQQAHLEAIDFTAVNDRVRLWRERSLGFLHQCLT